MSGVSAFFGRVLNRLSPQRPHSSGPGLSDQGVQVSVVSDSRSPSPSPRSNMSNQSDTQSQTADMGDDPTPPRVTRSRTRARARDGQTSHRSSRNSTDMSQPDGSHNPVDPSSRTRRRTSRNQGAVPDGVNGNPPPVSVTVNGNSQTVNGNSQPVNGSNSPTVNGNSPSVNGNAQTMNSHPQMVNGNPHVVNSNSQTAVDGRGGTGLAIVPRVPPRQSTSPSSSASDSSSRSKVVEGDDNHTSPNEEPHPSNDIGKMRCLGEDVPQ